MAIVIGPGAASSAWEDARRQVREDLWRTSAGGVPDDQCDRALHSSILELEAQERWLWLETVNASFNVASSSSSANLGADVRNISFIAYLSGTTGYDPLDMEPLHQIRQLNRGASPGAPSAYALADGGVIYFDVPVPDDSDFELVYFSRCPKVLADAIATPPASLTLQRPAIIANACHYVASTYLKNMEEAARQRGAYERILNRLIDEESDARSDNVMGGQIQPDQYHYNLAHRDQRYGGC